MKYVVGTSRTVSSGDNTDTCGDSYLRKESDIPSMTIPYFGESLVNDGAELEIEADSSSRSTRESDRMT